MPYRHTQQGTLILAVCIAIAVLGAATTWQAGRAPLIALLIILVWRFRSPYHRYRDFIIRTSEPPH
jgi:hypothetical protein